MMQPDPDLTRNTCQNIECMHARQYHTFGATTGCNAAICACPEFVEIPAPGIDHPDYVPPKPEPYLHVDEPTEVEVPFGDWVLVWGQLSNDAPTHPEDVLVSMESHNEQYLAHVRRDHVAPTTAVPAFAQRCTSLSEVVEDAVYRRCTRHLNHGDYHEGAGVKWTDADSKGDFEE